MGGTVRLITAWQNLALDKPQWQEPFSREWNFSKCLNSCFRLEWPSPSFQTQPKLHRTSQNCEHPSCWMFWEMWPCICCLIPELLCSLLFQPQKYYKGVCTVGFQDTKSKLKTTLIGVVAFGAISQCFLPLRLQFAEVMECGVEQKLIACLLCKPCLSVHGCLWFPFCIFVSLGNNLPFLHIAISLTLSL